MRTKPPVAERRHRLSNRSVILPVLEIRRSDRNEFLINCQRDVFINYLINNIISSLHKMLPDCCQFADRRSGAGLPCNWAKNRAGVTPKRGYAAVQKDLTCLKAPLPMSCTRCPKSGPSRTWPGAGPGLGPALAPALRDCALPSAIGSWHDASSSMPAKRRVAKFREAGKDDRWA